MEPGEVARRHARALRLRRRRGCSRRVVVPAERRAAARCVVLDRRAASGRPRRRFRRNHSHQARRQHLGSRLGRSRALGAVTRAPRARVAGGSDGGPVDRPRHSRERRRRVAGLSRRHGDKGGCRDRRAHRHRYHRRRRAGPAGRCCWRRSWRRRSARGWACAARRFSASPRSEVDAAAPRTPSPTPGWRRLPRCWPYRRYTATSRSWHSSPPWPRAGATR